MGIVGLNVTLPNDDEVFLMRSWKKEVLRILLERIHRTNPILAMTVRGEADC